MGGSMNGAGDSICNRLSFFSLNKLVLWEFVAGLIEFIYPLLHVLYHLSKGISGPMGVNLRAKIVDIVY